MLTEMLPFELPASMSNRHLWEAFEGVELCSKFKPANGTKTHFILDFADDYNRFSLCLLILFGTNPQVLSGNAVKIEAPTGGPYRISLPGNKVPSEPFKFSIRHKIGSDRTLSIMHPLSQIQICDFLDRNAEYIIYMCSRSPFSVRRPQKVASLSVNSWIQRKIDILDAAIVCSDETQENSLNKSNSFRSYFVYTPFTQAHQYHQSKLKSLTESKFLYSGHLDVQACFDSIYTHSIEWAGLGYRFAKDLLPTTFFSEFDQIMQYSNMKETNGILIGSEVSRIFAEIILQAIDCDLEVTLRDKDRLIHGVDYEIHRYVDDFHIYANSLEIFETIERRLQAACAVYKLKLGSDKRSLDKNPHGYNRSVAKVSLSQAIRSETWLPGFLIESSPDGDRLVLVNEKYRRPANLINAFQSVTLSYQVPAEDLVGYALHLVNVRVVELMNYLQSVALQNRGNGLTPENELWKLHQVATQSIESLIDLALYVFQCSPKVNPALKLGQFSVSLSKLSSVEFPEALVDSILQSFADGLKHLLFRERGLAEFPVERSYIMNALSQLGPSYAVSESELLEIIGLAQDVDARSPDNWILARYDYLSISSLMHYCTVCGIPSRDIRQFCFRWLIWRTSALMNVQGSFLNTELYLIASDVLSSPALDRSQRRELKKYLFPDLAQLTTHIGVDLERTVGEAIGQTRTLGLNWWDGYDFPSALTLKQSGVVY